MSIAPHSNTIRPPVFPRPRNRLAVLCFSTVLCVLQAQARAQNVHVSEAFGTTQLPVSPEIMNSRIAAAAVKLQRYAPIPRYAQYDFAPPRDAQEYAALQGHGVVLISVLTQVPAEMPPKRLVAKLGTASVPLVLYASGSISAQPDPNISRAFGSYRWEGLYLLPMYLAAGGAQLVMDFAVNRDGFVVAQFGDQERKNSADLPIGLPGAEPPPATSMVKFLTREYPGFDANRGLAR